MYVKGQSHPCTSRPAQVAVPLAIATVLTPEQPRSHGCLFRKGIYTFTRE